MRTRSKLATLVALVSLLGLVLVNVGGASGLHDVPSAGDDELALHINTDGDYFEHAGLVQNLVASQCLVDESSLPDSLVSLTGTNKGLGLSFDSLGVRSQGPGRSCGRTSNSESFEISINNAGTDHLAGLNFYSMDLDIEAKHNVVVVAETLLGGSSVGTFRLQTGDSATGEPGDSPHEATSTAGNPDADCLQGVSDSGSDNGANDNCRWTIEPGIPFDTVIFSVEGEGEFGLEGGEDTGSDSLFYLTDVGVLDCGDTETTDPLAVNNPFVSVTRQIQVPCQLKEFLLDSEIGLPAVGDGTQSFTFDPSGGGVGQEDATFFLTVTWVPEVASNDLPVTKMDFDNSGTINGPLEGDLLWCDGTVAIPILPEVLVSTSPNVFEQVPWCRVEQHVLLAGTVSGVTYVQMVEKLYGTEDPNGWR